MEIAPLETVLFEGLCCEKLEQKEAVMSNEQCTLYPPNIVTQLVGLSTPTLSHYRKQDIGTRWVEVSDGGRHQYQKKAVMELALAKALAEFGLPLDAIGWFMLFVGDEVLRNAPLPVEWEHDDNYEHDEGQAYLLVRNRDLLPSIQKEELPNWESDEAEAWINQYSVERINQLSDIARITHIGGTLIYPKQLLRKIPVKVYELPE